MPALSAEQLVKARDLIQSPDLNVTDEERELLMLLLQSYRAARDG